MHKEGIGLFFALTSYDSGKTEYINFDHVMRFFGQTYDNGPGTVLCMSYGNRVVRENPDEIFLMLRGVKE